ncbi:MAG: hypothetical protein WCO56_22855, partial [Verrucomicrobiota bacterium]
LHPLACQRSKAAPEKWGKRNMAKIFSDKKIMNGRWKPDDRSWEFGVIGCGPCLILIAIWNKVVWAPSAMKSDIRTGFESLSRTFLLHEWPGLWLDVAVTNVKVTLLKRFSCKGSG